MTERARDRVILGGVQQVREGYVQGPARRTA